MGNNKSVVSKIHMQKYDDLFGNSHGDGDKVASIPLSDLHPFKGHPFKVIDDEKMDELAESVKQHGVLVPGIARPMAGGGYELVAGHRRKRACEMAGLTEMPVVIRGYSDDEAKREDILPSEKAKAYKMKYEAMKHQGKGSGKSTLEEVGEAAGENAKKVQRYIWLSRLSDELLGMVDNRKLGFAQGLDISFLKPDEQGMVLEVMVETGCMPDMHQSAKLKEYSQKGELTRAVTALVLKGAKPVPRKVTLKSNTIKKYFDDRYSSEDIEKVLIQLLEEWKAKQDPTSGQLVQK